MCGPGHQHACERRGAQPFDLIDSPGRLDAVGPLDPSLQAMLSEDVVGGNSLVGRSEGCVRHAESQWDRARRNRTHGTTRRVIASREALAQSSGVALPLARDLIAQKLASQEQNVRRVFHDAAALKAIGTTRERVASVSTIANVRTLEAQAALAYWGCWRTLPVMFPKADLPRVPQHWQSFGARISPLTGSPRLSVNPANAILNYLYAVLESETRLAAAALGLDPGLGVMHMDTNSRDSLACDVMEPVPPIVDAYVLNWLIHQPLKREWFFEERNGACRLMAQFTERLSETAPTWAQAVAPIAERVARQLWTTVRTSQRVGGPATRLTEQHRRDAKGQSLRPIAPPRMPPRVCRTCGAAMPSGETQCRACWDKTLTERMLPIAGKGRILSQTPEAQARRAATRRCQWRPSAHGNRLINRRD